MKTILIINPVVAEGVNQRVAEYLEGLHTGTCRLDVINLKKGPESIETFTDEIEAGQHILNLIEAYKGGYDAIVINCFADPVVEAAGEISPVPVIGPAQASMFLALNLGWKFAVISIYKKSGPWGEIQSRRYGVIDRMVYSTGIEIPVLELEKDPDKTKAEIIKEAEFAVKEKGAEVIVLGCTGMASIAQAVQRKLNVPVIEPLAASVKMAEMILQLK